MTHSIKCTCVCVAMHDNRVHLQALRRSRHAVQWFRSDNAILETVGGSHNSQPCSRCELQAVMTSDIHSQRWSEVRSQAVAES